MTLVTKKIPTTINKVNLQKKYSHNLFPDILNKQEYPEINYDLSPIEIKEQLVDTNYTDSTIVNNKEDKILGEVCKKMITVQQDKFRLAQFKKELISKITSLEPSSVEYRNAILQYRIDISGGIGTRGAVVAAATYLSEEEEIPYFWGGKYSGKGINAKWNTQQPIPSAGSDIQFEGANWPYGLDCSGFVTWSIINGGYQMNVSYTGAYLDYIKPITYTFNVDNLKSGKIKAGDLLYRDGHIAIITELDHLKGTIKVAEEKGAKYGMVVTNTTIDDFVNTNKYSDIYSMEEYYNNPANLLKEASDK